MKENKKTTKNTKLKNFKLLKKFLIFVFFVFFVVNFLTLSLTTHHPPLTTSSVSAQAEKPDFIQVKQGEFRLAEQRFQFIGANLSITWADDRKAALETIEHAASDGITVARVWALGEAEPNAGQWFRENGIMRTGPEGWIEESFLHLDQIVAAASRQNIKLIIVLANRWADLGGMPQYVRWAGLDGNEWWRFYDNLNCRAWYREHLKRIVLRRNTITNRLYRDEPAIMAWELGNELNAPINHSQLLTDWVVEMADYLRELDGNHLIGAGVESYQTPEERDWWLDLHRQAGIDYADIHVYPETAPWISGWTRIERLLAERAATAQEIGLPLIIGEFGFLPNSSARAEQMRQFFQLARQTGAAGTLFWIYGPSHTDDGYHISYRAVADDAIREMLRNYRVDNGEFANLRRHYPLVESESRPEVVHKPLRRADNWRVTIPVAEYSEAEWSRWGYWQSDKPAQRRSRHVYGWRSGHFSYRIKTPRGADSWLVRLKFRASSEWPGADSPSDWRGRMEVRLDGRRIARLENARDDGRGAMRSLWLRLPANRMVQFDFLTASLPEQGEPARGLCLYDVIELRGSRSTKAVR